MLSLLKSPDLLLVELIEYCGIEKVGQRSASPTNRSARRRSRRPAVTSPGLTTGYPSSTYVGDRCLQSMTRQPRLEWQDRRDLIERSAHRRTESCMQQGDQRPLLGDGGIDAGGLGVEEVGDRSLLRDVECPHR